MEVPEWTLNTVCSLANFVRGIGPYQTEYDLRAFEEAERAQASPKTKQSGYTVSVISLVC